MDKTVQSYLNEYISLIGKGKFVLLGGNTFLDGDTPNLGRIVEAINKFTTTDGVTAEGIFESRLKNKAEVEIKKPDGTIEVAKGSATDAQYAAFVADWKRIQEPLVKALIAQFDIVEKAKGAAPAGASSLFGGVELTVAGLTVGLSPLKKAGDVAAVVAVAAGAIDVPSLIDYIMKLKIDIKEIEKYLTLIEEPGNIKKISDGIVAIIKANADIEADNRIDNLQAIGGTIYNLKGTTDDNIDIIQSLGGTIYNYKL
jgi:hypothetical protein